MRLLLKGVHRYSEGRSTRADVRISRSRILESAPGLAPRRGERVLAADGWVALPGLINAHDHLGLDLLPRLGRPPYPDSYAWAAEIYRPQQSPVRELLTIDLASRLRWGGYRNVLGGATTVVHHDPYCARVFGWRFPVKVLKRYAWAHSLGYGGDIAGAFAGRRGWPFMIHAAEGVTRDAAAEIDRLEAMGVLGPGTILVHAIALSTEHIRRLAARNVSVVWCPTSNFFLYGATAPVAALEGRVRVCLGTDSTMSGAATLLDELRAAAATGLVPPATLFEMVTTRAAAIFGLQDGRGTLRPGAPADVLLIPDTGRSAPEALLAVRPADFGLVLVDGAPRLANRDLATVFELGSPSVLVEGRPMWMYGPFGALRTRIEAVLGTELLAQNATASLAQPRAVVAVGQQ